MDMQHARVLVADDDPYIRNLLVLALAELKIEAIEAADGEQALALFDQYEPDLVLLDVNMPYKDGYLVCQEIKSLPRNSEIPIIFITAESSEQSEIQGLTLGAVDFLTKPIQPSIVLARVHTHLSLLQTRRALQQRNQQLSDEKEWLEDIVTKINRSTPFDRRNIRYVQSSVERTAGDVLLSAYRPDGSQHVLLGDFSGHGLPAAVGAILAPNTFYRMTNEGAALQAILQELNRILFVQLPTQLYMATCALEINPARTQATIWNYGMPEVAYLSGNMPIYIDSQGLPLGISDNLESFEPHRYLDLIPESAVYLHTDGINEARDGIGEQFGDQRLRKLLGQIFIRQSDLGALWACLRAFCGSQALQDDVILVEVRR